jgi:hypothetical protein
MEKLFDFKTKLAFLVILASFFANSDSVLGSVLVVYEQKSKISSTSINKKKSRLLGYYCLEDTQLI